MLPTPQPFPLQQKLHILREHIPALAPWPAACGALIVGIWVWAASTVHHEKHELLERARITTAAQARTYAEQIERTIGQLDYIMLSLHYQWRQNGGWLNLEDQVKAGLVPEDAKLSITVFDRHGMPVTSTSPEIKGKLNIASREYFRRHASNPSGELFISKPMRSILTGRDVLIFSRRLNTEDGTFAGIMALAIEPRFLASFVDESKIGKDGFASIRTSDGVFIAAKTSRGFRTQGPNHPGAPEFSQPSGVRRTPADRYLDRKDRIVAWSTARHYPIVAVVGESEGALLEEYASRGMEIRMAAGMASMLLFLLGAAGMRRAATRIWQEEYAREVRDVYRTATENARDGFFMLRPLYGSNREIVDFLIEDCNERGALYRGLPRETMIGKTLSATMPHRFRTHMLPACRQAMEIGLVEDELDIPQPGSRTVRWMERRLVRSGAGLAVTLRDITETRLHQEALERLANADALTSLPNRHWLTHYLPAAIERAREQGKLFALMFVDLDDFKNINDTMGHEAGDELLRMTARRLQAVIRPEDKVARLGGDEFTILVEQAQSREEVATMAERIIETLRSAFALGETQRQHVVHASVGISLFPIDGADGATLLKHADIAMYAAKAQQKGTYRFFEPSLERRLVARLTREAELKIAIARGELVLHYQPRVSGDAVEITSMEALVRWMHPVQGLMQPNEFIPLAERTGLIVALGEQVIRMACEQLALWKQQGLPVVPISVNVSAQQLDTGTLSAALTDALREHALDTGLVEVEVTESATVTESGAARGELAAIQAAGIKLYVDDFGTGYSSLAQLKRLDMDGLKIDRAFTSQMLNGPDDAALFAAILAMAHALRMKVVAEGVETAEQLAALRSMACEEVQGYYISRPVPAHEAAALLKRRFLLPAQENRH
ncbi:bifunctional diguanylate cyclase/phosphodiesterase [Noviherbaspirillum pedocola]|uniref:EAL domain-containing protein n=1 Tax=Noviherbaspirillum pedocola TaxID=2801341 RepID=A0A934STK0_9BURK|nr:EAL domain-containing protein [Noviherbaspirillum pedocola]MBK4735259.1 EAL domain-containing protein [Noviherbaspirillum pedocola]